MARHTSMRGELIDFNRLVTVHGTTPALGNANKNARGDAIDRTGVVIKTQEQIMEEFERRKAASAQRTAARADLKADLASTLAPEQAPPPAPVKQTQVDDAAFEPAMVQFPAAEPVPAATPETTDTGGVRKSARRITEAE